MDACLCMGARIGMAGGAERAQGKAFSRGAVAVLGDSTFIHSGITSVSYTHLDVYKRQV